MAVKKKEQDHLEYKGRPLIRSGDTLYYGSMGDKYIVMLQILASKDLKDISAASRVLISLMLTDESLNPVQRIVKTTEKSGLYDAIEIGSVWLERALLAKE